MKTTEVKFFVPDSILNTLNQDVDEFVSQLRLLTSIQLFKTHKLSFGQAAELAGLRREHFLTELDKYDVDVIDYDPSELEEELKRFRV